jgi:membrane-associated HD superfamily phosphohydrolase
MATPSPRTVVLVKLSLLLGLSGIVTQLIVPHLTVGPPRIQPGDILQDTLVIPESVTLEDERSTELRRRQALADFAPIFDYDTKLRVRTLDAVRQAFVKMRETQAALSRARGETAARLRQNTLDRISILSDLDDVAEDVALTDRESTALGKKLSELGRAPPGLKDKEQIETLRFQLKAVEGRRASLEARQASGFGRKRAADHGRLRAGPGRLAGRGGLPRAVRIPLRGRHGSGRGGAAQSRARP